MTADELKETTLDVKKRIALKVSVDDELETDKIINELMGRDVSARFNFIMERAGDVDEIDV